MVLGVVRCVASGYNLVHWIKIFTAGLKIFTAITVSTVLNVQHAPFCFRSCSLFVLMFSPLDNKLFPCDKCALDVTFCVDNNIAIVVVHLLIRVVSFTYFPLGLRQH